MFRHSSPAPSRVRDQNVIRGVTLPLPDARGRPTLGHSSLLIRMQRGDVEMTDEHGLFIVMDRHVTTCAPSPLSGGLSCGFEPPVTQEWTVHKRGDSHA